MSFTVYVRMKKLGKQKKEALAAVPFVLPEQPTTLRELLTALVELGVDDYNARRDTGEILAYLTREEIQARASAGKVSFGLHEGGVAKREEAVANAIQCFEDGIYRVFAGEEELTQLEEKIFWRENMEFTLIRLTMLAGMW